MYLGSPRFIDSASCTLHPTYWLSSCRLSSWSDSACASIALVIAPQMWLRSHHDQSPHECQELLDSGWVHLHLAWSSLCLGGCCLEVGYLHGGWCAEMASFFRVSTSLGWHSAWPAWECHEWPFCSEEMMMFVFLVKPKRICLVHVGKHPAFG